MDMKNLNLKNVVVRDVTIEDAKRLVEIYANYVLHTAVSFESERNLTDGTI